MEPNFVIEPSYTKEEMRQFAKLCWKTYLNTRFISVIRVMGVCLLTPALVLIFVGILPFKHMFFWIFFILLGIILSIFMPKIHVFACIGVGIHYLAKIFNKNIQEKVNFFEDHVNCVQFKNIPYRELEILELEDQFILKIDNEFLLVKPSDLLKGSYEDLKNFLYDKQKSMSVN